MRYQGHASREATLMAVIERERLTTSEQAPERAIFVAADGRRARRLRGVGFVAGFLACLWVVGLAVGMLGFGSLPGVSLVKQPFDEIASGSSDAPRAERKDVAPAVRRLSLVEPRTVASVRQSPAVRSRARAKERSVPARPVSRPPAQATPPPPVAQQPVNPAQRPRGWARRGQPAPPGQSRKTTPPPPPRTRGRGQTPPTTPPPVPPGQAKKALPPPPPPPPKKA